MAVIDFFDRGWMINPNGVAYLQDDKEYRFAEVGELSCRIAHKLLSLGLTTGSKGAVWALNDVTAWTCTLGLWRANMAWIPVGARNAAEENHYVLDAFDCDILFFKPPHEIMDWAEDHDRPGSLYSIEQYVPLRNARNDITGYRRKDPLPTDANAGLLCLDKRIHDLDAIDGWIGRNLEKMDRLATFEQHAYNYLLQIKGGGIALPDTYSFNYTDDRVVASHFAIKNLFFENLHRLKPALTKV